jgi:hypothetical protein
MARRRRASSIPLLERNSPEGAKTFARQKLSLRFGHLNSQFQNRSFRLDGFTVADASSSQPRTEYCCDRGRRFRPRVLTACSGRFLTAGNPNRYPILTQAFDAKSAAGTVALKTRRLS